MQTTVVNKPKKESGARQEAQARAGEAPRSPPLTHAVKYRPASTGGGVAGDEDGRPPLHITGHRSAD